jgi:hypothetical protein
MVFTMRADKIKYYESPVPLFGDGVFNAFPSADEDIAEAGACLALGRGTASVMHLMRASEVGLLALAKALGVGKKNDWGSYLREIDKELILRAKASGARSAEHVDRSYSQDRAEEIFQSVRSFMRHLSSRITE